MIVTTIEFAFASHLHKNCVFCSSPHKKLFNTPSVMIFFVIRVGNDLELVST